MARQLSVHLLETATPKTAKWKFTVYRKLFSRGCCVPSRTGFSSMLGKPLGTSWLDNAEEKRAGHSVGLNPLGEGVAGWQYPHWIILCNNTSTFHLNKFMMQPHKIIVSKCSEGWVWSLCGDLEVSKQTGKNSRCAKKVNTDPRRTLARYLQEGTILVGLWSLFLYFPLLCDPSPSQAAVRICRVG